MMTKFLAAFWLGIWLYFGTFLAANPTLAASTTSKTTDTAVQQFLVSIPRDYYTVKHFSIF